MKTRCPSCQTTFRVTPEQLKARAGKVRCGQCQAVFNALDALLDEAAGGAPPQAEAPPAPISVASSAAETRTAADVAPETADRREPEIAAGDAEDALPGAPAADADADAVPEASGPEADTAPSETVPEAADTARPEAAPEDTAETGTPDAQEGTPEAADAAPPDTSAAQDAAKAAGLILPRDTTEIPGYSKWSEGVVSAPPVPAAPSSKVFTLIALLLVLALAGQSAFHWRGEIAVAMPGLRPALATLSGALGQDVPLPHDADLVSIEASDLQTDAARGGLLILQATLRNRAPHAQPWPLLELSLTDTLDNAIVRRVFQPSEYLPTPDAAELPFAGGADVALRLWIEAKDVDAAGYRLYVFYP